MKYTNPNFSRSCLVTIDVQCDTLDGRAMMVPGTTAAVPNMAAMLHKYRELGLPIIHMIRIYKEDGSNAELCRKATIEKGIRIFIENTSGCQLAHALFDNMNQSVLDYEYLLGGGVQQIGKNEYVIYKPRWGAFYQTPLQKLLSFLKISSLVIMGSNFPNGPRTSIFQASERDFKVALVNDATSGLYETAVQELDSIGVEVLSTTDILEKFQFIERLLATVN